MTIMQGEETDVVRGWEVVDGGVGLCLGGVAMVWLGHRHEVVHVDDECAGFEIFHGEPDRGLCLGSA